MKASGLNKKTPDINHPEYNDDILRVKIEAERTEFILKRCKSMIGAALTIFLLLIYSLYYGEPGSAPYVVSQLTMGICAVFFLYCIIITRKCIKKRQALKDALSESVFDRMERTLANREPDHDE